ncbi:RNA dependent RNA polymerase-domain-containing protein [Fusarium flagelliforme]|uniref:RNA dependent RNA polymerase-domain-containing protein n=1 Tax=Fusarium flagelliforme TaxID=2675880 RepID=UPI001E8D519C|nr:RNA dependent RNA polymerase-domain-containing protein [Fusarium flagelliforme]KAH7185517.1 RNA dependent RNA polymerase-domain-containing protein [Fusarium flagelliforme]
MNTQGPSHETSKGLRGNPKQNHGPKGGNRENPRNNRNRPTSNNIASELRPTWLSWPELTVHIKMPASVTISNLWSWFSRQGEIAYMDINESPEDPARSNGKIRFEPPPKKDFWSTGACLVPHPDSERESEYIELLVNLGRQNPECFIRSPVCKDRQHPIKTTLKPITLEFGTMLEENSMKVLKSINGAGDEQQLRLELSLKHQKLTIFFPRMIVSGGVKAIRHHKVVIDFSAMKYLYQTTTDSDCCALVIPLERPPQYYWKTSNVRSTFADNVNAWSSMETWNRATDIVEEVGLTMNCPIALNSDYKGSEFIDIGHWATLRLVLDDKTEETKNLNRQLVGALHDFNISARVRNDFQATHGEQADMWKYLDHDASAHGRNASQALSLYYEDPVVYLPFEVRYQLEVCISQGQLNEHKITKEFLDKLAGMPPHRAKYYLEFAAARVVHEGHPMTTDPMSIFDSQRDNGDNYTSISRIPPYCGLVRKAVITPTTVRYATPNIEVSNRVMRRYKHIQDRFLRIQFTEELEKGRIAVNKDQNDEIYKKVLRTMYEGIRIGDRLYEFLAFGNSQLRVNGAYFFCPTEHTSCDGIREWMGQFSHIRVAAKYAARLGQCFSTTRDVRGISSPDTLQIPDIERNGYCFTDGVGKISRFLAQLIVEDMALDVCADPSAFQFRMGGCKGVLTIWPDDAKGMEVHVRESQKKFESESKGLEIIRWARLATATLNRQTITILESLGVPTRSFTNLLAQQLRQYELATSDNDVAIEMLDKFRDEQQSHSCLANLLRADFRTETLQEPFVVNAINLWRSWSIKSLKEKAHIQVQKSAFVLGCVDETGTLRGHFSDTEGSEEKVVDKLPQIFLQVSDPKNYKKTSIIRGVCIVGRNPSLHPGDIRVVEAVDCKTLHHLKDVVVFPSTGDRPVPNMLSGGDLDGDDFFVIWESSLIPNEWNYPPMNYSPPNPIELDRDVGVNDLRNFFVKYLKNDKLPLIATSHLALSDELGPKSPKCLELAELHSKAVDYPKTGDPAILRRDQQPRKWPHFMEKKNSYHSRKALGVIFDRVVHRTVDFNPIWDSPFDERITKKFRLDSDTLKAASKIKAEYDTAVRRLLSQHALKTEFELFTGFALTKPAVGSDYKVREDLDREFRSLKEHYQDICIEAAGGKQAEDIEPFVAAMYTVTEEQVKAALSEHDQEPINDAGTILQPRKLEPRSMPLISFPWIFYGVMCCIATDGAVNPKTSLRTYDTAHHFTLRDVIPIKDRRSAEEEGRSTNIEWIAEKVAFTEEEENGVDEEKGDEGVSDTIQDAVDSQQDEESEDDAIDRLDDLING